MIKPEDTELLCDPEELEQRIGSFLDSAEGKRKIEEIRRSSDKMRKRFQRARQLDSKILREPMTI